MDIGLQALGTADWHTSSCALTGGELVVAPLREGLVDSKLTDVKVRFFLSEGATDTSDPPANNITRLEDIVAPEE